MRSNAVEGMASACRLAQAPLATARNMAGVFDCDVDVNTGLGSGGWSGDAATA
jgi:hypothetical protein